MMLDDERIHWPDDPVVDEVRAIRAKLWKEGGGTFEGLMRVVRETVARAEAAKNRRRRKSTVKRRKPRKPAK